MDAMTDREKEIFRQAYESGYKQGFEAGRQQGYADGKLERKKLWEQIEKYQERDRNLMNSIEHLVQRKADIEDRLMRYSGGRC